MTRFGDHGHWSNVISQPVLEGGLTAPRTSVLMESGSTNSSSPEGVMTEISDVKNAAVRLRAIYHNQAIEGTTSVGEFAQPRDERMDLADVALEAALIAAGMMLTTQAIAEIASLYEDRKIVVVFEDGQTLEIHV